MRRQAFLHGEIFLSNMARGWCDQTVPVQYCRIPTVEKARPDAVLSSWVKSAPRRRKLRFFTVICVYKFQKMEATLLEPPAAETAQAFAHRLGYRSLPDDLELTWRVVVIGTLFAVVNGIVNMFFAFRYAGGLAQYWVILVAYPICKATERLPRGRKGFFLNPGPPFSPKEHTLVMTMAIAGSLAGTLGLSGGMLALSLDFGVRLNTAQIYIWALMAGFFGIFFGTLFFESLVLPTHTSGPFPVPTPPLSLPSTRRLPAIRTAVA